jgi:hypothetical protein
MQGLPLRQMLLYFFSIVMMLGRLAKSLLIRFNTAAHDATVAFARSPKTGNGYIDWVIFSIPWGHDWYVTHDVLVSSDRPFLSLSLTS